MKLEYNHALGEIELVLAGSRVPFNRQTIGHLLPLLNEIACGDLPEPKMPLDAETIKKMSEGMVVHRSLYNPRRGAIPVLVTLADLGLDKIGEFK